MRMIIGITGTNGAGKGAAVDYLVEKGFTHYSSSGFLGEELDRRGIEKTRTNLRAVGNEFRAKYGSGYLTETFLKMAAAQGVHNMVIESVRSTGEAKRIKAAGGIMLVVDADRKLRYDRIFARKTGKDFVDFDTFVTQEEREWYGAEGDHDMNMRKVMDMGDHTIQNDGSLEELKTSIDEVLQKMA